MLASFTKEPVLLENYYFPGELEDRIRQFVDYYNHKRNHESLSNLTPADVFYARRQSVLANLSFVTPDVLCQKINKLRPDELKHLLI